jgi:beta-lactamase regulating signal transducer with metallopeptidase domain
MSVLFLNHFADGWSEAIWRASWQGGLAVILVWTLTRAWQRMPPLLRCWLWRFVFIKFAVAFFCPVALELAWLRPDAPPPIAGEAVTDSLTTTLITHTMETFGPEPAVVETDPVVQWPAISAWLMLLWLGGLILYIVRLQRSWWTTRRLRQAGTPVEAPDVLDKIAILSERMGMAQPPSVRTASSVPGPLVIGIFRPVVILPTTLLERGDKAELELVLAHELAHCRRWDLLWEWLPTVVRAFFFFHPLVWLASREARLASEIACDELAIQDTDRPASAYADVLLRVAMEVSRYGCRRSLGAIGVFESYQSLKRRLKALANFGSMSPRQLRLTSIPAFVIAVALIFPWRLIPQTIAGPTGDGPPGAGLAEAASEDGKTQTSMMLTAVPQFPHAVPIERGATQFLNGDKITIQQVRGTAEKIAPGNIYWIRGTYTLASHPRATLSAYVTAQNADDGRNVPTLAVQTTIVNKGEGSFTLYLPVTYRGWPHVSFYPADGGNVFGGTYFGTGDSVLKDSTLTTAQQAEQALKQANGSRVDFGDVRLGAPNLRINTAPNVRINSIETMNRTEARRRRWQLNCQVRGPVDQLNQLAALGAILAVPEQQGGYRVFSELRVRQPRGIHMDDLRPINRLGFAVLEPETVSGVARELDIPSAAYLLVFLPQELEHKMHEMEEAYRGAKEDQIHENMYFEVVPRGTGYDVVVNEKALGPPPAKPNQQLKDALAKDITIEFPTSQLQGAIVFPASPLQGALDYMAERYEFHFQIDDQAFQKRGVKSIGQATVSGSYANKRLSDVLQKLLDQAHATYRVSQTGDSLIIVPK